MSHFGTFSHNMDKTTTQIFSYLSHVNVQNTQNEMQLDGLEIVCLINSVCTSNCESVSCVVTSQLSRICR